MACHLEDMTEDKSREDRTRRHRPHLRRHRIPIRARRRRDAPQVRTLQVRTADSDRNVTCASDARIEEEDHECLPDDPEADARDMTVRVRTLEVTRDGTTAPRRARREAGNCSDSLPGATRVPTDLRGHAA